MSYCGHIISYASQFTFVEVLMFQIFVDCKSLNVWIVFVEVCINNYYFLFEMSTFWWFTDNVAECMFDVVLPILSDQALPEYGSSCVDVCVWLACHFICSW